MLGDDSILNERVLAALPIFPLPNVVLLPGMVLPLNVFEPRYLELVDHVLDNGRHIGVPLLRPGFEADHQGRPSIEPVFGLGKLVSHERFHDGRRFIRLEGVGRVRMLEELPSRTKYREVSVEMLPEHEPSDWDALEVLKAQVERVAHMFEDEDEEMVRCVLGLPDRRIMVYAITAIIPNVEVISNRDVMMEHGRCPQVDFQQRCLAAPDPDTRIRLLLSRAAQIVDQLGESGRYSRVMLN